MKRAFEHESIVTFDIWPEELRLDLYRHLEHSVFVLACTSKHWHSLLYEKFAHWYELLDQLMPTVKRVGLMALHPWFAGHPMLHLTHYRPRVTMSAPQSYYTTQDFDLMWETIARQEARFQAIHGMSLPRTTFQNECARQLCIKASPTLPLVQRSHPFYFFYWFHFLYLKFCLVESPLALANAHPRDQWIFFIEKLDHSYYVFDTEQMKLYTNDKVVQQEASLKSSAWLRCDKLCSATTWLHELFPKFDKYVALDKTRALGERSRYHGMSDATVFAPWDNAAVEPARLGHEMHENKERYYNRASGLPFHTEGKEWSMFCNFERDHVHGKLRPFRVEWRMFDLVLKWVGSADMIYEYDVPCESYASLRAQGKRKPVVLCDWKRIKKFRRKSDFREKGNCPATAHMDKCELSEYTIQLHIYAYMLMSHYEVDVMAMFLVLLHPDQEDYIKVDIEYDSMLMVRLVDQRRRELGLKDTCQHESLV